MTVKHKPVRFKIDKMELLPLAVVPRGIPPYWKCLRMLVVPVSKKLGVRVCAVAVDPVRYKKNIKFRKKVLAKLKREIQKSYRKERYDNKA